MKKPVDFRSDTLTQPSQAMKQAMIEAHWHTIEEKLGTQFNYDFWRNNTPRRSTYNACRAVIASNNQGYQKEMIEAIQRAYYLQALNPSDDEVLIGLAKVISNKILPENSLSEKPLSEKPISENTLPEQIESDKNRLNLDRFISDFASQVTQQALVQQIQFARELTVQGFPSLVLECSGIRHAIPINYQDAQATLSQILALIEKH